jgi:hypothetical protein
MPVAAISSFEILKDEIQQKTNNGAGICIGRPRIGSGKNYLHLMSR